MWCGEAAERRTICPPTASQDAPVLILGVDHVVLDPEQEGTQRLDLAGEGLAGAALGEDDLVGVLLLGAKGVEDNQRAVVDALAVEEPTLDRELA